MVKHKQVKGRFNFTVERKSNGLVLCLDDYRLALYPLTYTLVDCLEHFCDGVGWELATCRYHYEGLTSTDGSTTMLRPFGKRSFSDTFWSNSLLYKEGLPQC